MPTITHTDYLLQKAAATVNLNIVPGVWVRLLNNSTSTNYFSTAVTDAQGAFTHSAVPGDYSLFYGNAATVPGTPTLVNAHYSVPVTAGDDAALGSVTALSASPYLKGAYILPGDIGGTPVNGLPQPGVFDFGGFAYHVKMFGAKLDGQWVTDGSITTGTKNLTTLSAQFLPADVGKLICVQGAGSSATVPLVTTIAAYVSPTAVTTTAAAGTTAASVEVMWATDDTAAIQAGNDFIFNIVSDSTLKKKGGGPLIFPFGVAGISAQINQSTAVVMKGAGSITSSRTYDAEEGTGFFSTPSTNGQWPIGTTLFWFGAQNGTMVQASKARGWGFHDLSLDGANAAGVGYNCQSAVGGRSVNLGIERVIGSPGQALLVNTAADAVANNCIYNRFTDTVIWLATVGIYTSGGATGQSFATLNDYVNPVIIVVGTNARGVVISKNCDTEFFSNTAITLRTNSATAYCILCNDTATPNAEVDASGCQFYGLTLNSPNASACKGVVLNTSSYNMFIVHFSLLTAGNELVVNNPANTSYVFFLWNNQNADALIQSSMIGPVEAQGGIGNGVAAMQFRQAGTLVSRITGLTGGHTQYDSLGPGDHSFLAAGTLKYKLHSNMHFSAADETFAPTTGTLGANVASVTVVGNDTEGRLTITAAGGGAIALNTRIAVITFVSGFGASKPPRVMVVNASSGANDATHTAATYGVNALAVGTFELILLGGTINANAVVACDFFVIGRD